VLFGSYHEAVEAYGQAIRKSPEFAEAYYNRGLAYHMSYRPVQGCQDLSRAIELNHERSKDAYTYFCGF
jgi:tetratricopeptide (TPR) repeat protein